MFSYTKKEVVMLAQELNVQKQTLERVLRLIDVLKFINTDEYLKDKKLKARLLHEGYSWFDTGTFDSLLDASNMIRTIENNRDIITFCGSYSINSIFVRVGLQV